MKNVAAMGCPMPGMNGTSFSKKFTGICSGMGSASPIDSFCRSSGRTSRVVATKLHERERELLLLINGGTIKLSLTFLL